MKKSLLYQQRSADFNIMPDPNKNILEHFIDVFSSNKDEYFAWDNVSGTSSRGDFMLKATVVSQLIRAKTSNKYVGIMLPALQSTTLLIVATYMAGKVPVMLNWTVGQKVLVHCADLVKLDLIITASAFYNKVKEQIPEEIYSQLICLDKEVKNISATMKLKGLLMAKLPRFFISTKIEETAVVLFTSGSETLPKAVPLTHQNIVNDLYGALQIIDIRVQSVFLSFLPPFHSFGFTVLSVLPLITGVKVAYTPNPTNLREVVEAIRHNKANNLIATPTLLKMILAKSSTKDLKSIELVITGAESLHQDIKKQFEEVTLGQDALIVEGYGITECSPIVSLNSFDAQKLNSVGKVIYGLDLIVVNPETHAIVGANEEGMFLVSGPSVFSGYLDENIPSPFVEIEQKRYYKTGDLGYVDEEGYVFITGRLKRFIKIGGEMISMPFLEKLLQEEYGREDCLSLAVEGTDAGKEPKVVLFSVDELKLSEVNKYLRSKGVASLARIREVKTVKEIPLLGSGKVNYRELKQQIEQRL